MIPNLRIVADVRSTVAADVFLAEDHLAGARYVEAGAALSGLSFTTDEPQLAFRALATEHLPSLPR